MGSLTFALSMTCLPACRKAGSGGAPLRPPERYSPMDDRQPSRLHVPIEVRNAALEGVVNMQLPEQLVDDRDFLNRGFTLEVERAGDVAIQFDDERLHYRLPLRMRVSKDAILARLSAGGTLEVELATALRIGDDWALDAETELVDYRWTERPRLGVGAFSLPIEGLTERLIERVRDRVAEEVDRGIRERLDLRAVVERAWSEVSAPRPLGDADTAFLVLHPSGLALADFRSVEGGLGTAVEVSLRPEVVLGAIPAELPDSLRPRPLPRKGAVENDDPDFELALRSRLPYGELQRVLAKALLDTTFEKAGRSATVRALEVYGQDRRLVLGLRLEGDYQGWAYLRARPVFDADSERVELRDVDIDLDTRSALVRTVGWLLRGRIKRELNRAIGEKTGQQLAAARTRLDRELRGRELAPGIRVEGGARELTVEEFTVAPDGLWADLHFRGRARVIVDSIPVPTDAGVGEAKD